MAEAADRLEALVAEAEEVLAEDLRRAHDLVDAGRGREGGHVEAELGLELAHQVEDHVGRAASASATSAGDLPEVGLLLAGGRPQRLRSRPRRGARRGRGSRPGRGPRGRRGEPLDVLASARRTRGRPRTRGRARAPGCGLPSEPPRPRSCAGCRPGGRSRRPRRRRCPPGEASSEARRAPASTGRAAGRRVLAHRGVDRAGVLVLDAGRRDARAVWALG